MRKLNRWLSGIILVLVFIAGIIFSYFNTEQVAIAFGNWQSSVRPLSVWIIGAFVTGGVLGLLFGLGVFRHFKSRSEIRRLNKELALAKKEVRQLRAMSLKDLD
ncbi:MAG: LapA family protein [Gammaproteobacteria bacterium]